MHCSPSSPEQCTKRRKIVGLAVAVLAAGAVMVGIGAARGENAVVEAKAVRICLECIGIG